MCIRLYTEILLKRLKLPAPTHPEALLSKRYAASISTNTLLMSTFPRGHRDDRFNDLILPQCEPGIRALGHALAYSFAVDAGVDQPLLDLFEMAIINLDAGWYVEHVGIDEAERIRKEDRAVAAALPKLKGYVDELKIRPWVVSPIITDERWEKWVEDVHVLNKGYADGLLARSDRLESMLAKL